MSTHSELCERHDEMIAEAISALDEVCDYAGDWTDLGDAWRYAARKCAAAGMTSAARNAREYARLAFASAELVIIN